MGCGVVRSSRVRGHGRVDGATTHLCDLPALVARRAALRECFVKNRVEPRALLERGARRRLQRHRAAAALLVLRKYKSTNPQPSRWAKAYKPALNDSEVRKVSTSFCRRRGIRSPWDARSRRAAAPTAAGQCEEAEHPARRLEDLGLVERFSLRAGRVEGEANRAVAIQRLVDARALPGVIVLDLELRLPPRRARRFVLDGRDPSAPGHRRRVELLQRRRRLLGGVAKQRDQRCVPKVAAVRVARRRAALLLGYVKREPRGARAPPRRRVERMARIAAPHARRSAGCGARWPPCARRGRSTCRRAHRSERGCPMAHFAWPPASTIGSPRLRA